VTVEHPGVTPRAALRTYPDLLALAAAVPVPPDLRGASWEEIRARLARPHQAATANRVTEVIDTNVLIRHLTGDAPGQASRATALLIIAQPRQLVSSTSTSPRWSSS
jgi:hypothetical protein